MKRLCCFLTGGHEYSDENLCCKVIGDEIIYTNVCVKCGKIFETRVPKFAILPRWMGKEVDE